MQWYTIKEVAELSGLPDSTLRYYESMELIGPIARDSSSGHRTYSEDNLNFIIGVACLNATGMSIENMRTYFSNMQQGGQSTHEQIRLLQAQKNYLAKEAKQNTLKRRYVEQKIAYWQAIAANKTSEAEQIGKCARLTATELQWIKI